jgi:hypothetical protein
MEQVFAYVTWDDQRNGNVDVSVQLFANIALFFLVMALISMVSSSLSSELT